MGTRMSEDLAFTIGILYTVLTFAGALMKVDFVWTAGETLNYLMAAPNMLALLVLNREVRRETAFA